MASFYILFFHIFSITSLFATDYYVDKNTGNDGGVGSINSPWKTIGKANSILKPGDKVYLRGGEYSGQQIAPKNSGTSGKPISYIAFENEKPILTNVSTGILLDNREYIIVEGIHIDGKKLFNSSGIGQWAQLHNTHHCVIKDCNFKYAKGWAGVSMDKGSSFNKLLNNRMDYCGTWDDGKGEDKGDVISMKCASNNLLEGNHLTHGGHNLLAVFGGFNVFRNNIFDNSWGKDNNGNPIGNRCLAMSNEDGKTCSNTIGGYNVFEYNIVKNSHRASDNDYPHAMKAQGENQIVRFNLIYSSVHSGISGTASSSVKHAAYQRIYNNTICNSGGPSWLLEQSKGVNTKNNIFKNNISAEVGSNPKNSKFGGHVFLNVTEAGKGSFNDNKIIGNCFYSNNSSKDLLYIKDIGLKASTELEKDNKDYIISNKSSNPKFVSSDPEKNENFELSASSPLIDAGIFLTQISNGSGSGKQLQVKDARYFSDGFNITKGDRIQVGKKTFATISKVDYQNNILYLNESISWQNNDFVGLPYLGDAPDIGAREFNSAPSIEVPVAQLNVVGEIDFGILTVDSTLTKVVKVENIGDAELIVSKVTFPKYFSGNLENNTILPGEAKNLTIAFSPEIEGEVTGKIIITSNAVNDEVNINLSGKGKSAIIPNKLPIVKISSPISNSNFNVGEKVNLKANASDPDGEIKEVGFYINNVKLGIAISDPYTIVWEPLKEGKYIITAKAIDDKESATVSESVSITILKSATDSDNDGIDDENDNCPNVANPDQELTTWFLDNDNDGYGGSETLEACSQPSGYVSNNNDCDDKNSRIHPKTKWYLDADKDGLGSDEFIESCIQPDGYVLNSDDDNDEDNGSTIGIIDGFILYDAVADIEIKQLSNNDIINLNYLENREFNIQINTQQLPRSIEFYLNGQLVRTENKAPFTMYGDRNGDYFSWTPKVKSYELIVKAYSQKDGKGEMLETRTISFEFVDEPDKKEASIEGFTLINASTDQVLGSIIDAEKINLSYLQTNELNIEGNILGDAGSIEFYLDGNLVGTETKAPYSMFGSKNGDYNSWKPELGKHIIEAKVYAEIEGKGDLLDSKEIEIFIIKSEIDGFELINAESDQKLGLIKNNEVINLANIESKSITIEAKTSVKFGSVLFYLNGDLYQSENAAPYALNGDNKKGDFYPSNLPVGNYQLKAKAFSEKKGKGKKLATYTISFSIVDNFNLISPVSNDNFETGEVIEILANVPLSANERTGKVKVEFYADDYKIGEATEYPYQIKWSTFTKGNHKITAKMVTLTVEEEELGVTPEVVINVEKINNLLPSVKLLTLSASEYKYGSHVELEVTANDKDGIIDKVKFFNEDNLIGEVEDGENKYNWKYPEPGYYTISALAYDNDGDSTFSEAIEIIVLNADGSYPPKPSVDIEEFEPVAFDQEIEKNIQEEMNMIVTYGPNPVSSMLNLSVDHPSSGEVKIIITDTNGKRVEKDYLTKENQELNYQKDLSSLTPGMYLIRVKLNSYEKIVKILKH